jgi:hypothetical protein
MPPVTLAFSVFCVIEAVICSTDAEVSRRSPPVRLRLGHRCAGLTSSEADDSASALACTVTTCASLAVMFLSA